MPVLECNLVFQRSPSSPALKNMRKPGTSPADAADNKLYYEKFIAFDPNIPEENRMLLFDPQTSGGLLLGVPEEKIDAFMTEAKIKKLSAWVVGEVIPGDRIEVHP